MLAHPPIKQVAKTSKAREAHDEKDTRCSGWEEFGIIRGQYQTRFKHAKNFGGSDSGSRRTPCDGDNEMNRRTECDGYHGNRRRAQTAARTADRRSDAYLFIDTNYCA